jgi:hypothetical protein
MQNLLGTDRKVGRYKIAELVSSGPHA